MTDKPITYIATYCSLPSFPRGIHEGRSRDVVIAGAERPDTTLQVHLVNRVVYANKILLPATSGVIKSISGIDETIVYLCAVGTPTGYSRYLESFLKAGMKKIQLVACGCDGTTKERVAEGYGLPLIWSECGGRDTLEKLVRERLLV